MPFILEISPTKGSGKGRFPSDGLLDQTNGAQELHFHIPLTS